MPISCQRYLFIGLLLCLAHKPANSNSDPAQRILVKIENNGEFKVLHSRAKSTATGALFFGLIGAGIEEGSRAGDDHEREAAVLVHIPDSSCRTGFDQALTDRLTNKGYSVEIVGPDEKPSGNFDIVMRLKIHACGYKLNNSTSEEISAFYAVSYLINPATANHAGKMSDILMSGVYSGTWPELLAMPDLAAREFDQIRIKAGRRLANMLIYPKDKQQAEDSSK
jgi:hypothetical protein